MQSHLKIYYESMKLAIVNYLQISLQMQSHLLAINDSQAMLMQMH